MDDLSKDVMKITEICRECRYNRRSVFDDPCRAGMYMIHYSGTCAAYRPSLRTVIKKLFRKGRGE